MNATSVREEFAWCAGFFDGEGNVMLYRRPDGTFQPRLNVGQEYYRASGTHHVQRIVASMWAWLSPVKRQQATDVLSRDKADPRIKSGRRPTCRKGHALDETNMRLYVQHGWTSRACRLCVRDRMRFSRAKRRTAIALLSA